MYSEHLGSGIAYEGFLPLRWRSRDAAPNEAERARVAEDNEKCLRVVSVLNEYPMDLSEEQGHLEFKLNLVLELVGDLIARQLELPAPARLRMGAEELIWVERDGSPTPGSHLAVDVYLHAHYPRPFVLTGTLTKLESGAEQGPRCHLRYDPQPEAVQDLLEKFIFLHHRRSIAHTRRG